MPLLWPIEQTITSGQTPYGAAPTTIPVQQAGNFIRQGLHYPLPTLWRWHELPPVGSRDIRDAELLPDAQSTTLAFVEYLSCESVSAKIVIGIMLHSAPPLRVAAAASPLKWACHRAICVKPRPRWR